MLPFDFFFAINFATSTASSLDSLFWYECKKVDTQGILSITDQTLKCQYCNNTSPTLDSISGMLRQSVDNTVFDDASAESIFYSF